MRSSYLLLLFVAAACGCSETPEQPDPRRDDWLQRAPARYVVRVCSTGFEAEHCVVAAVENQVPTEAWVRGYEEPWRPADSLEDPIDMVFDAIGTGGDCRERIEVDPDYGFPSSVYFDCGQEGDGLQVDCFVADETEVSVCRDAE